MGKKFDIHKFYKISLFFLDTLFILASFFLSILLNNYRYPLAENYGYIIFIYLVTIFFYIYFDFYKYKSLKFIKRYLMNNIIINVIIFGLITLFIFITPYGDKIIFINLYKYYILVYLLFFLIFRVALFKLFFNTLNKARRLNKNAVILGVDEESKKFYSLKNFIRFNCGLNIIGFIGPEETLKKTKDKNIELLGSTRDILDLSGRYKFKDVFLIDSKLPTSNLINTVEYLRNNDFFIHISDRKFDVLTGINQFEVYGSDNRFVDFSIKRLYYKKYFKFLFDYIFSVFILIIISPFLLLLMLLIKSTSKGPALFIGKRIGLNKREFNFIKFRSMKHDTEENIRVHRESIKSFYNSKESGKIKVYSSNQRITRVGRFLRKFSLDELPQFINVLKGDMSIIGPRPCMKYEADYFKDWRKYRFDIKPGITGLWQAYGRSRVNFEKLSILEYYYYSNCSFSLDLKILFDTIKVMILGIGGY